jgi:hypothetical protein
MDLIPTKAEIGQILRPQMWDATVTDMQLYPSVTIFCTEAPAVARQIMGGPNSDLRSARSAFADTGAGSVTGVTSISAVGRYDMSGGEWISLGGDLNDGTFYISGGSNPWPRINRARTRLWRRGGGG